MDCSSAQQPSLLHRHGTAITIIKCYDAWYLVGMLLRRKSLGLIRHKHWRRSLNWATSFHYSAIGWLLLIGMIVMAVICLCAGCETFSWSGTIHPAEERSRRISSWHESFWRGRWRRRGWRYRRGQWRGGNHSHTQLPHHLLPFCPGKPTQQVL